VEVVKVLWRWIFLYICINNKEKMNSMENKVCSSCSEEKPLTSIFFHKRKDSKDGFRGECKICNENKKKEWREKNPDKIREYRKFYKENNPESYRQSARNTYLKYYEYYRKQKNDYWALNGKKIKEKVKEKKTNDPFLRLYDSYRARLKAFFKGKNKSKSTKDLVGCSWEELKMHLETQFKSGMSWDNYGLKGWHIDHIIPLSSAITEAELIKLSHYSNLQPLWAKENLTKSNKISDEFNNLILK
jgi:hypothetical protein